MTATFDLVAGLPVTVDDVAFERLERDVSSGFTRVSTVVTLSGGGEIGCGEDVTYEAGDHDRWQEAGAEAMLGTLRGPATTFAELADRIGALDLFPTPPDQPAYRAYRRWGVESAALDLALRQAKRSLADVLGRTPRPLRYVVSLRLGEPSTLEPLTARLAVDPTLRWKLDAAADWDDALVADLAALGTVDVVDLKGQYEGTVVDAGADPDLYRRVAEGLPDALIEDPRLTPETDAVLAPHRDRITWDAPIHAVADIEGLPFAPRVVNIKPSRFGSVRALLDGYDYCAAHGIDTYGGGQFELGVGRDHIQILAALFSPEGPNDVGPGAWNDPHPSVTPPPSPLALDLAPTGFRVAGAR